MMHFAYPNAQQGRFEACARYLSLPPPQAPGLPYRQANPRTPHLTVVHDAVQDLVPERAEQLDQGTVGWVYERADREGPWQGASLDLAYFLALIRCSRRCVLEACADLGDVWCTGELDVWGDTWSLKFVDQRGFEAKLDGFLAQVPDGDRLFLVPTANVDLPPLRDACRARQVQVLSLRAFRTVLATALAAGGWPDPAVVYVGTRELELLVDTLFAPPRPLSRPRSATMVSPRRPYKFLDAFGLMDAALFCGRDQDIARLQRMLTASRLLILHGASGTGKTSVLQAGVLPSLPAERYAWVVVRMVDAEPTAAIKAALVRECGVDTQLLAQPLLDGVQAATAALGKTVVLILDQFEECFQRHTRAVRQQLHEELRACLDAVHLEVHVVIALREDYLAQLAEFQEDGSIPAIFHHTLRLTRFSLAQAYDAIVQPAQRLGLHIDETLVQDVLLPQLTDAEHTIELPMLQIVCDTWYAQAEEHSAQQAADRRAVLGEEAFAALGDIHTVLGRYLDTTVQQFGQEQQQAREVLKALVTAEDTKRAVFLDELLSRLHTAGVPVAAQELEHRLLRRLVQARLVRAAEVEGRTRYELTHEFLVTPITAWIAANERERTKVLELIARAYEAYKTTGLLLPPEALVLIAPFQEELVLPDAQRALLVRSQQRARQQRRGLLLRVGAVVLAVIVVGGGIVGWRWQQDLQRRLAQSYAAHGRQELLEGKPQRAAVYLSEAYTLGETRPALRMVLKWALRSLATQLTTFGGHTDQVFSASFSPDGAHVVTASADRTGQLWDAATGQQRTTFRGHIDWVFSASFSPDGARLVTASADRTARLWEAATGQQLRALQGHTDWVYAASFSPDGARLVTASRDGTAQIWEAATGQQLSALQGHTDSIYTASFSPDGARVVTASADRTVQIWDAATGQQLTAFRGHSAPVSSASFSPDGTRVVTASRDGTAQVWDAATSQQLIALQGHTDRVSSASFSPDGRHVVTVSMDGAVQVWDATTGQQLIALQGHTAPASSASFSPDGRRVVTASADGTAQVWDTATGQQLMALQGHTDQVYAASFSPDGRRVVTASADGTARIWDAATGQQLRALQGHTDQVYAASFSPDGRRVVTASADRTARIWDAATGQQLIALQGHTDRVSSASFSPDGTFVVTASDVGTAQIWDAATGHLLISLQGYLKEVYFASFSPDGTRVMTASADRTVQVWDVDLETLSAAEIMALVRCRVPWRLNTEGQLLQAALDPTACAPRAVAR